MKKQKQTYKKAPGHNSGSDLFQFLIISGIILSAAVLSVSLLAYYRPSAVKNAIMSITRNSKEMETQAPEIQVTEEDSREPSSERKIPYMVPSQELGNVSDLSMEDSYSPEAAIYSVMLDTAMGPMLYYNQGDIRWGDYLYGGADPMKKYGCGPTAVSMLINSFSPDGASVTPKETADWAAANNCYAPQSGSYHRIIPDSLQAFGLEVESVNDRSSEKVRELLESGHVLAALMGKGALTNNGHFILITRLLDNGNVHIADPNSLDNSTKEWDLDLLLNELKKVYDSGGPLWAVGFSENY